MMLAPAPTSMLDWTIDWCTYSTGASTQLVHPGTCARQGCGRLPPALWLWLVVQCALTHGKVKWPSATTDLLLCGEGGRAGEGGGAERL